MDKDAQAPSENKPVSLMPAAAALKLRLDFRNERSHLI